MAPTFVDGQPYWVDVSAPDVPGTVEFYHQLFGWQAEDMGEESGHYTIMSHQGESVGAIGPSYAEGTKPAWTVYFKVSDAHATTKAIEAAGGTVRVPPMDVFDQTTLAQFTDTSGADFAISQPKKHQGAQKWGELGSVSWVELDTRDTKAALPLYRSVFGWTESAVDMNGNQYTLLTAAGGGEPFGGAYTMTDEIPESTKPHWMVFFEVADCDASHDKAKLLGAGVLMPPTTVQRAGRFAVLTDPNGAQFAVISSE